MMNTILRNFAQKNTNSVYVYQVNHPDKPIFKKYFKYFLENGYSEKDAKSIADLFQSSADKADIFECDHIQKLGETNNLILRCTDGVELYARAFGTKTNQFICKLSLETALCLADTGIATWEHTSRHFLEYYFLA